MQIADLILPVFAVILTGWVVGVGVGMFFLGYVVFEVPGSIIVERWSARKWLARIMITWGVVTILTACVHSATQFYVARFLVGLAEASFFPGIIGICESACIKRSFKLPLRDLSTMSTIQTNP